jgi:hypothetical protein
MPQLNLPQVTLCAVTSVNVAATVRAMAVSMRQIAFADCVLLTHAPVADPPEGLRVVPIGRIASSAAYSRFVLGELAEHVATPHCLLIQWDGHVLDAARWQDAFLDYDYIGARWPQFDDGHDVGNGGFSLRSHRLLRLCQDSRFATDLAEDLAIGRRHRAWLEQHGIRFAPPALADAFSAERAGDVATAFGYHGVFNMPRALGADGFWQVYGELDEMTTVRHDFRALLRDMLRGPHGIARATRMIADRLFPKRRRGG